MSASADDIVRRGRGACPNCGHTHFDFLETVNSPLVAVACAHCRYVLFFVPDDAPAATALAPKEN